MAMISSEYDAYKNLMAGEFYDMALDYSSDRLFAVGWSYAGDTDGNGQDDGNNLFHNKVSFNLKYLFIRSFAP